MMITSTVKRIAVVAAMTAMLAGGGVAAAGASVAAVPTVTVAECDALKVTAMDTAKTNFKAAKAAAWTAYEASTKSKKDAAKDRRMALKTAIDARKVAFTAARTAHNTCIAGASDKPAS